MSARKLMVALSDHRKSAYELRATALASQILAKYRGSPLRVDGDTAAKPSVTATDASQARPRAKSLNDESQGGRCSHRSSVSTDVADDEEMPASPKAEDTFEEICSHICEEESEAAEEEQEEEDKQVQEDREATSQDLTVPAEDVVAPLPPKHMTSRRYTSFSGVMGHRKSSSSSHQQQPAAATATAVIPRRKFGTILREHPQSELYLFREEAEYSDYLTAMTTGTHAEMDAVVFYEVQVHLSQTKWTVLRRFSDFHSLRQRLLKHLARRQKLQCGSSSSSSSASSNTKCMICADILHTLEQVAFPSRKQPRKPWFAALRSRAYNRTLAARTAVVVADRTRKLQDFVHACLLTIRGLRQHSRLMCDSSACEISVALRMIEEFLGLSFTRYMRFLNERGVLESGGKSTKGKPHHHHHHGHHHGHHHHHSHHSHHSHHHRAAMLARQSALQQNDASSAGRRATIAV